MLGEEGTRFLWALPLLSLSRITPNLTAAALLFRLLLHSTPLTSPHRSEESRHFPSRPPARPRLTALHCWRLRRVVWRRRSKPLPCPPKTHRRHECAPFSPKMLLLLRSGVEWDAQQDEEAGWDMKIRMLISTLAASSQAVHLFIFIALSSL